MCRLILNFVVIFTYFFLPVSKLNAYFIGRKPFVLAEASINKKHYTSFFDKKNYNFSIEIPKKLTFRNDHNLKYQISITKEYDLNSNKFLFLKYFLRKQNCPNFLFESNVLTGYGYNIFYGPVFFSKIQFSPDLYCVRYRNNNFLKLLIYSSGQYSYRLIDNIYYSQSLSGLASFKHINTKLENAISIIINDRSILLQCSYNISLNENKFFNVLSNVNKYFAISITYSL